MDAPWRLGVGPSRAGSSQSHQRPRWGCGRWRGFGRTATGEGGSLVTVSPLVAVYYLLEHLGDRPCPSPGVGAADRRHRLVGAARGRGR